MDEGKEGQRVWRFVKCINQTRQKSIFIIAEHLIALHKKSATCLSAVMHHDFANV